MATMTIHDDFWPGIVVQTAKDHYFSTPSKGQIERARRLQKRLVLKKGFNRHVIEGGFTAVIKTVLSEHSSPRQWF